MNDKGDKVVSRYAVLEKPEFVSAIPHHLTAQLSDQEKYLVETLSRMEQHVSWLVANLLVTNKAVVDVDCDVQKLVDFKKLILSKWSVVFWVVTMAVPIFLKVLLDYIFRGKP